MQQEKNIKKNTDIDTTTCKKAQNLHFKHCKHHLFMCAQAPKKKCVNHCNMSSLGNNN